MNPIPKDMMLFFDKHLCWNVNAQQRCPFTNRPISLLIQEREAASVPVLVAMIRRNGKLELGEGVAAHRELSKSGIETNATVVQFFKMLPPYKGAREYERDFTHIATCQDERALRAFDKIINDFIPVQEFPTKALNMLEALSIQEPPHGDLKQPALTADRANDPNVFVFRLNQDAPNDLSDRNKPVDLYGVDSGDESSVDLYG